MRTGQGKFALLDLEQPGLGCLAQEPAVLPAQLVVLLEGWDRVGDAAAPTGAETSPTSTSMTASHMLSSPWTFSSVSHVPGKGG